MLYSFYRFIELDCEKKEIGGLKKYFIEISQRDPFKLVEYAPKLVKEIGFKGIGPTTIFHLMKNLGMNIFKPDIHVRRILSNLGLIDNENENIQNIYHAMVDLSLILGIKLNKLDTYLFNYGRINGDYITV
jgi:thermostable 8-oxoguanine DNA glycosylase